MRGSEKMTCSCAVFRQCGGAICLHTEYVRTQQPFFSGPELRVIPIRNNASRDLTCWYWAYVDGIGAAFVKGSASDGHRCQNGFHSGQNCGHVKAVRESLHLPAVDIDIGGDEDFTFGEFGSLEADDEGERPEFETISRGYPYPVSPEYNQIIFDRTINPPRQLKPPLPMTSCHCGCSYLEAGYHCVEASCMVYNTHPTFSYTAELFILNCPNRNSACQVVYGGYEDAMFRLTNKTVFCVR